MENQSDLNISQTLVNTRTQASLKNLSQKTRNENKILIVGSGQLAEDLLKGSSSNTTFTSWPGIQKRFRP